MFQKLRYILFEVSVLFFRRSLRSIQTETFYSNSRIGGIFNIYRMKRVVILDKIDEASVKNREVY